MLAIGIASYNNAEKLDAAISHIVQHTVGEWQLLIVDNDSDMQTREVILRHVNTDSRITKRFLSENIGYVGAVNQILKWAQEIDAHYIAYCDNDCNVLTSAWNRTLEDLLEAHHDMAMAFPATYVSYPIHRNGYQEILWGTGCFWMLNTARINEVGYFDEELGHQEEVDYQMRLRLAGWKIGATPNVQIQHFASATTNPEAQERINKGVINWVNKWNKYFVGPHVNYHSWNVTRFEDWMSSYLEEWYLTRPELQGLNSNPEQITVDGRTYDLIKVPRYPHLYRDRII